MTPRTDRQIAAMVAKLNELKPQVVHYSVFGNDHHKMIDLLILAAAGIAFGALLVVAFCIGQRGVL